MNVRSTARSIGNAGGKIITGSGITVLVFFWAITAYAFSKYFDFTGQTSVFVAHTFTDLWGNSKTVYSMDIWNTFAPMLENLGLAIDLFFDIPAAPNLGSYFNFSADGIQLLKAIFNLMTLGFPVIIRVVAYLLEIGVWMIKVTTIAPLAVFFSLAGGVIRGENGNLEFFGGMATVNGWLQFSLSDWLNSVGL